VIPKSLGALLLFSPVVTVITRAARRRAEVVLRFLLADHCGLSRLYKVLIETSKPCSTI
jgi:hypothetical protein